MTRTALRLIIMLFLIIHISSCRQQVTSNSSKSIGLINERNYNKYIAEARNGWSARRPFIEKKHLNDLLNYIRNNKTVMELYRKNPDRWLYDIAMIQLMSADYLNSFKTFNDYIESTKDNIRPFLHIGLALNRLHNYSGEQSLKVSLSNIASANKYLLDYSETIRLIQALNARYIIITLKKKIPATIKNSKEYKRAYKLYLNGLESYRKDWYDFVKFPSIPELIPKETISELEKKSDLPELEIDFFIQYFTDELTCNFEKAAYYSDKKKWSNIVGNDPEYILSLMMVAYLKTKRYDDVINLYALNKNKIRERRYSEYYIYLWLGAAYAGKGELEKAKEYLKEALDITTMEDGYHVSYPEKGSILFAIFNLVFFTDEYDIFEKMGRYDEIEAIVETSMSRFKNLQHFN